MGEFAHIGRKHQYKPLVVSVQKAFKGEKVKG